MFCGIQYYVLRVFDIIIQSKRSLHKYFYLNQNLKSKNTKIGYYTFLVKPNESLMRYITCVFTGRTLRGDDNC